MASMSTISSDVNDSDSPVTQLSWVGTWVRACTWTSSPFRKKKKKDSGFVKRTSCNRPQVLIISHPD